MPCYTGSVVSFRVLEMLVGASEPERYGMARQRLTRMLAPQTMETPIYFHMTESESKNFRATVDQLAEVGFDMIFYSFGSGFNLEKAANDNTTLNLLREDIAYANAKGIEGAKIREYLFFITLNSMIQKDHTN